MIKYKGTTLYPPAMHNALNDFPEVGNFVIEIFHNSIGTDEIGIKIATNVPSEELLQTIRDHFRSKLRVTPGIEFVSNREVEKLRQSKLGRKPVSVIDRRP